MSAADIKTSEAVADQSVCDQSICYILDETGDTSLADLPKNVNSDLVDENEDTSGGQEMKPVSHNPSARSTPSGRKKAKKRKRQTYTPVRLNNNNKKKLTPGGPTRFNKPKKRKKSVILIDSDTEPDISIVEIDDDSVIVLSDDEMGVCSGSLSPANQSKNPLNAKKQAKNLPNPIASTQSKKPFNPSNLNANMKVAAAPSNSKQSTHKIVVEDLTGKYIPSKSEGEPKKSEESEKVAELYQPLADKTEKRTGLRPIVIDGCNVAFGHGRDRFSSLGLKICVDYFKKMGHEVRAFIPQFRKHHLATTDPQLLEAMEKDGTLILTPSRRTDGKMIVSYDDRFIVQYADANGGVIVSRDNYRDLLNENPEWKETVNKRLLMFTWVGDSIMFPKDPLGRDGPKLQEFLRF